MKRYAVPTVLILVLGGVMLFAQIEEEEPIQSYVFLVQAKGVNLGYFMSLEGLEIDVDVVEHLVVNEKGQQVVRKLPGRLRYGDVKLKKGYLANSTLNDWIESVVLGNVDRRNITITLLDPSYKAIRRWNCSDCWPKAWKMGKLSGKGSNTLLEEFTFVMDSFTEE